MAFSNEISTVQEQIVKCASMHFNLSVYFNFIRYLFRKRALQMLAFKLASNQNEEHHSYLKKIPSGFALVDVEEYIWLCLSNNLYLFPRRNEQQLKKFLKESKR